MMHHHHSKFGYRWFSSWLDIGQMNIPWNFEPFLCPWPWPQQSDPIFSQENPSYDDVPSNQVNLHTDLHFKRHNRNLYFNHMILHFDHDLEDSKPILTAAAIPCVVVKGSAIQKISSGQTFINIFFNLLWPWPWTQSQFPQDILAYDNVPSN